LISSFEIKQQLERVLLNVQKPGRYVGGELNQVLKDWKAVKTHIALVFPDIYDIGLPNLGLAIFYDILNKRHDVLAERSFAPWLDMEIMMRKREIPLYSLESKTPLMNFDIVAFSIPYESLYTNVLNIMDLAKIPIFTADRNLDHPLIIAGGHAMFNPEPMAPFLDAIFIGEGDEAIEEIVDVYQLWKKKNAPRGQLLRDLAAIPGMYIPSFYNVEYQMDGTIKDINPIDPDLPGIIKKRVVANLPLPPTHFIVPSIDVVHNRVPIEIMRGCTRGCRFCHAGMINRPVRERPVHEIVNSIRDSLQNTGYEEVALLSLSSSDYSQIVDLVDQIKNEFIDQNLFVSLPSLRIESLSVDILDKFKDQRQNSFTLAPEAATEHMRNIINKPISTDTVMATIKTIYQRGWANIKLYFMIGQPGETIEDVRAIIELSKSILAEGKRIVGNRVRLNIGIGTFVPKPHTPFQWVSLDTRDIILEKQSLLKHELRKLGIKVSWADYENTMLEAFLSRGDRNLADVIFTAWKNGAKFDAWNDEYKFDIWLDALGQHKIDPHFYTDRQRSLEEIFPWEHISILVKKIHLKQEYQKSLLGETTEDCRTGCYACGVLPELSGLRKQNSQKPWNCPD